MVVISGCLGNIFVFWLAERWAYCTRACDCFPAFYHIVLCWFGIYMVLDNFIVFFFDLVHQNWDGDAFKLFNWYNTQEGGGMSGAFITLMLMGAFTCFAGFLWYRYMVFHYMDGRVLDLYRRLNGDYKLFFMPHDNEVSLKYL